MKWQSLRRIRRQISSKTPSKPGETRGWWKNCTNSHKKGTPFFFVAVGAIFSLPPCEIKKNTCGWSYIYHIYWQTTGLTIPGSITNLENLDRVVKCFFLVVIADTCHHMTHKKDSQDSKVCASGGDEKRTPESFRIPLSAKIAKMAVVNVGWCSGRLTVCFKF